MNERPQNGSANAPSGRQSGPTVLIVEDEEVAEDEVGLFRIEPLCVQCVA